MKIEFANLEEYEEWQHRLTGPYVSAMYEFQNYLRNLWKYGELDEAVWAKVDAIYQRYMECCGDLLE